MDKDEIIMFIISKKDSNILANTETKNVVYCWFAVCESHNGRDSSNWFDTHVVSEPSLYYSSIREIEWSHAELKNSRFKLR